MFVSFLRNSGNNGRNKSNKKLDIVLCHVPFPSIPFLPFRFISFHLISIASLVSLTHGHGTQTLYQTVRNKTIAPKISTASGCKEGLVKVSPP